MYRIKLKSKSTMATISRQDNNMLFGPTVGDKIRLANTDLYVEIEKDLRVYGDEAVYGGGKTLRDGMGLANECTSGGGSVDLVITNVTILDPVLGVVKADVGIKDGKISLSMKALNDVASEEIQEEAVEIPQAEEIGSNLGALLKGFHFE